MQTKTQSTPDKSNLSGLAANVILSGMAAKTILIGLVAMKSLSGSAAKTTIWLSGLAADTSLSGMAAKTKTLLSGLAAVKHGSQDQHGPNLFFLHNPWLQRLSSCNAQRRSSYNKFKLPSACCPMAAARHSSWNAARWRSPTMNSSCLRHTISSSCVRHGAHGARQFPLSVVYQILTIYHNFSTISHHLYIIYHHKPWGVDRLRTIYEPSSLN